MLIRRSWSWLGLLGAAVLFPACGSETDPQLGKTSSSNSATSSSSSSGMGGAGGAETSSNSSSSSSGSTGGGGGAAMGACTNTADSMLLNDASKDVPGAIGTCAQTNFGMEPATLNCIKMTGLSDACSVCFDDSVHCVIMNCLQQCFAGQMSQPCIDCRVMKCDPAFTKCSGITP